MFCAIFNFQTRSKINIQIFINPCFDRISKGILSGITGIEIIDNYKVFCRIYNLVFMYPGSPIFEQLDKIVHSPAAR